VNNARELARACADAMYARDTAARELGIVLDEVDPGYARLSMTVRDAMTNGHAICHGGYIFSLADTAFAYACNSGNFNTVASGARIEFLAPARTGDRLSAEAREVMLRGNKGIYDVVVSNTEGETLALFRGNSHRIKGSVLGDD